MRSPRLKNVLSLALALLMLAPSFSSCGGGEGGTKETETDTATTESPVDTEKKEEVAEMDQYLSAFEDMYGLEEGVEPLDYVVEDGGLCSIFQSVAVIGDSLSSGEFEVVDLEGNHSWHDMYEYSWGSYMARDCGFKITHMSKGGMTAKEFVTSYAPSKDYFTKRYKSQVYIIALGYNDMWRDLPKGTVDDINHEDYTKNAESFAGYYAQIIQRMKEVSPDAFFFLVTMAKHPDDKSNIDQKRQDYAQLLYDMSDTFEQTYVIDLYKYAPEYDDAFKERFWMNGHLNPMGYRLTAQMFESYIDYYIRKDPKAFYEVGFMDTVYYTLGDKAKK